MARRRKKTNKFFAYILLIIFLMVFWIGFYEIKTLFPSFLNKKTLLSWNNAKLTGNTNQSNKPLNLYVNSLLVWTGFIKQIPYNIKIATSYQLIFSWKKFFAKSDNYLLGDYENKPILFSWVVIGFSPENIPVVNITFVKSLEENKDNDLSKNTVIRYKNLIVDLSNFDNFRVNTWDDLIISKVYSSNCSWDVEISGSCLTWEKQVPYLKISYFKCDSSNPITDCLSLKHQFEELKFDKITNSNWVVFYKLPETNNYEVLGDEYGYYFYPLSGNFYSLINAFSLVDTKQNKLEAIKNTCKNDNIKLESIVKKSFTGDLYSVIWFDQNSNKVICKLTLKKAGSTYVGTLQSLDYLRDDSSSEDTLNPDDYLIYKSRAYGFSVYMPKWIKYKSDLVNEDFWISWLKCLQVVNIAHRKKWNLLDPDVKVYYCKSQISKYLIEDALSVKEKKYKVISKDSKVFIIMYKDNPIANKIINYLKVF